MSVQVYYHIFAADREQYFDIVTEQIECIKNSPIYDKIEKINICLTGNHRENYDRTIEYIKTLDSKFVLRKCEFDDNTYERFTLLTLRDDILEDKNSDNNKYLYLHSKGATTSVKHHKKPVHHWRRCMMYFLLTKGKECLQKLDEYDTVGIFRHPTYHIPHYSGNFWWSTGSYLRKLFMEHTIDSDYLGPEMYLFKAKPNSCDLYPMPNGFDGYVTCFPYELYKDYEIK
jgi:hypothetical protein